MGRGIATPRLAAAVANAGGLGMVSVYGDGYTSDVVAQVLDSTRTLTSGAIGLWCGILFLRNGFEQLQGSFGGTHGSIAAVGDAVQEPQVAAAVLVFCLLVGRTPALNAAC
ncbi:MAG: nitronate monooxygenase [Roseiflexaceae bacterium]